MTFRASTPSRRETLRRLSLAVWLAAVCVIITGSLLTPALLARFQFSGSPLSSSDKVNHFVAYTLLALLPVAAVELATAGVALAAAMIPLGVILEFAQRLVPGRSFELLDMVANTAGVLTGILLALSIRWAWRAAFRGAQPA